jgi:hypothetical protein
MSVPGRVLHENLAVRQGGTPGTWAANASTYGNWVLLKGVARRAMAIVSNGELDGNLLVEVFEATDSAGAGAQELTGITTGVSFVNGTDEGKVGLIEVFDGDLSDGFSYVAIRPTPAAADSYSCIWLLSDLWDYPAANLPANGVSFIAASFD